MHACLSVYLSIDVVCSINSVILKICFLDQQLAPNTPVSAIRDKEDLYRDFFVLY